MVFHILLIAFDPQVKDEIIWVPSTMGNFSLHSAWELIGQRKSSSLINEVVWNNAIPLKISVFTWKLLHNNL